MITKELFGNDQNDQQVFLYTLTNSNGVEVKITNFGGIIVSLKTPDRNGTFEDIVLGFDKLKDYFKNEAYFGCIVGRCAGRISNSCFTLDGTEYNLAKNWGQHHLHGGIVGFNKVTWNAEQIQHEDCSSISLEYLSPDGQENYPGNLSCQVVYTLTNENELKIEYNATTDKPTIVTMTNHSYFNLAGYDSGNVLGQELTINSDQYLLMDKDLALTGEMGSLEGTPLDFSSPKLIGERIADVPGGYDHIYVLNNPDKKLKPAAKAYDPENGRLIEVLSTEHAIVFYAGNFLDGSIKGKGTEYNKNAGFCLETQDLPDAPNHEKFPSIVLRPGEKYNQKTVFKFSTK